jgi:Transposase IS4
MSENEEDLSDCNESDDDSNISSDSYSGEESDNSFESETEDESDVDQVGASSNMKNVFISKEGMEWSQIPTKHHLNFHREPIQPIGPHDSTKNISIVQTFRLFINDEMLEIIVKYTNKEANVFYEQWNLQNPNKIKHWKLLTIDELLAFIGLTLYAGVTRGRMEGLEELWSTECGRALFPATMGIRRFIDIYRFLRFDDKSTRSERRAIDKLAPIRDVWEILQATLPVLYIPDANLTVDEQLYPFQGRSPFRQYIPSKASSYGHKVWWICCSKTSYPLKGEMYLGKEPGKTTKNIGAGVVHRLSEPWKNTGRNIVMDNFFTSIPLAQQLLVEKTTIIGTLKKNKVEIPAEIKQAKGRVKFSSIFCFNDFLTMVSYAPQKNKIVTLLSTAHHTSNVSTIEKRTPDIITDYNKSKGGVDNFDHLTSVFSCRRKTKRYPMNIFYNILDTAAIAAFIIYVENNPQWGTTKEKKRKQFLKDLCQQLCHTNITNRLSNSRVLNQKTRDCMTTLGYELPGTSASKTNTAGRCILCARTIDRKSRTTCVRCGNFVCAVHSIKTVTCQNCIKS